MVAQAPPTEAETRYLNDCETVLQLYVALHVLLAGESWPWLFLESRE